MRTLLICHADAALDREGMSRWLGSFSNCVGTIVIDEPRARMRRRIAREINRVGYLRFLDVLGFRALYALSGRARDRRWARQQLEALRHRFPDRPSAPELRVSSPNSEAAEA